MTADNEKHLNFILSRFKSGQINAGQVVREIKMVDSANVQFWVTHWNHLHGLYVECQSELAAANRRIAELEESVEEYRQQGMERSLRD